jgi:hypothetical protein
MNFFAATSFLWNPMPCSHVGNARLLGPRRNKSERLNLTERWLPSQGL